MHTWYMKSKYSIIPNGIKISTLLTELPKYTKFTYVSVGRLETVKNHRHLIEDFSKIQNNHVQLKIIGNGSNYYLLNGNASPGSMEIDATGEYIYIAVDNISDTLKLV